MTTPVYELPAEGTFWQSTEGSGCNELMAHLGYHFSGDSDKCEVAVRDARQGGEIGLTSEKAPFRELSLEVSPDEDPAKPSHWRLSSL